MRGERLNPAEVLARHRLALRDLTLRDTVFRLASACLGDFFARRYPEYPSFTTVEFTRDTIPQGADAALRAIAGGALTRPAQSVLEALKIGRVEGSLLTYQLDDSPYACWLMEQLEAQPAGKVLNRSVILQGSLGVEKDIHFGLEPEWLLVELLAMVRQKSVSIQLPARKIDSDDLADATRLGVNELVKFTSVGRPKTLPSDALKALFGGLGLPEAWVDDTSKHEFAVQQLQAIVLHELESAVRLMETLREGLRYWRENILAPVEIPDWRTQLDRYKTFLDSLQHLTTPGRLRNFSVGVAEVRSRLKDRALLSQIAALNETLQALQPGLDYIYQAEVSLPSNHPRQTEATQIRIAQLEAIKDPAQRTSPSLRALLNGGLANLRTSYAEAYIELHNRARLNSVQDGRKKRMVSDKRWAQLNGLAALDFFFTVGDLQKLEDMVNQIGSCPGVGAADLKSHTLCLLCNFNPRDRGQETSALTRLEETEARFETLFTQWLAALRSDLSTSDAMETTKLLADKEREMIETFVRTGELPERISERFIAAVRDALRGLEKVSLDGPRPAARPDSARHALHTTGIRNPLQGFPGRARQRQRPAQSAHPGGLVIQRAKSGGQTLDRLSNLL